MTNKLNRTAVVLLVVSALIVILSMPARGLSLLNDFGPEKWFQYLIAMMGFLGVGAGLFIKFLTIQDRAASDHPFVVINILGGLYIFVMGFVLVLYPRWLDLSISGFGLMVAAVGFLYFFEFHKKFRFLRLNPNAGKRLLLVWMTVLLVCFLFYWGAPLEFWQILDRFGINVDAGSLLRNFQNFLNLFFTFPR